MSVPPCKHILGQPFAHLASYGVSLPDHTAAALRKSKLVAECLHGLPQVELTCFPAVAQPLGGALVCKHGHQHHVVGLPQGMVASIRQPNLLLPNTDGKATYFTL